MNTLADNNPLKPNSASTKKRIASIDMLRGLVMLLMLVDHVRERFFYHQNVTDPMTLDQTSSELFFTRMTAHLCAPVFVFLAGMSAWLYANPTNAQPRSASQFLMKRGVVIILIEVTLINFSWFGTYDALYLQVMWAIGVSLIALSLATQLPRIWVGMIGFIIVFGHNILDFVQFSPNEPGYTLWTILHDRGYLYSDDTFTIKASNPVIPWIGVIFLGYFAGPLFKKSVDSLHRQKYLLMVGICCLFLLLVLRGWNIYGEALAWQSGANLMESIKAFINFTKYPPSLDYLLLTLGTAMLLLALLENVNGKIANILKTFGAAPMFFYILHLYVLLLSYQALVSVFGTTQGAYWGLDDVWQIWAVSALLALLLYFPTYGFAKFKQHSSQAWIKYF